MTEHHIYSPESGLVQNKVITRLAIEKDKYMVHLDNLINNNGEIISLYLNKGLAYGAIIRLLMEADEIKIKMNENKTILYMYKTMV